MTQPQCQRASVGPRKVRTSLRDVPGIIDQLVSDFRDFVRKHIRMDGDGVDDQVLSINMSPLTFPVLDDKSSDQIPPPRLVQRRRAFAPPRPSFPEQQPAPGQDGRIAELEVVFLGRGHKADGRPSDDRVRVFVPGDSDVGVVVVQVVLQHRDDHGPDPVMVVQELSGPVVLKRPDEDVCQSADVLPCGVADVDVQLGQAGKVEPSRRGYSRLGCARHGKESVLAVYCFGVSRKWRGVLLADFESRRSSAGEDEDEEEDGTIPPGLQFVLEAQSGYRVSSHA